MLVLQMHAEDLRIVSLSPAIDNYLASLGKTEYIVGTTSHSTVEDAQVVGDVLSLNVETVLRLQPDYILTTPITPQNKRTLLEQAGATVHVFDTPRSFSDLCRQYIAVASLVGDSLSAEKLCDSLLAQTDSLNKVSATHDGPTVFFQIGKDPLFTITQHSFIHDYLSLCGAKNIAADAVRGNYSMETLYRHNPDVIIATTMGQSQEKIRQYWQDHPSLKAVATDNVFIMDADSVCSPSPPMFMDVLFRINRILETHQ